jgi:hypothetical protein
MRMLSSSPRFIAQAFSPTYSPTRRLSLRPALRGAAEIKPRRRRCVARLACDRPEEELLIEVMAFGQIVAADQAGVLALEI